METYFHKQLGSVSLSFAEKNEAKLGFAGLKQSVSKICAVLVTSIFHRETEKSQNSIYFSKNVFFCWSDKLPIDLTDSQNE